MRCDFRKLLEVIIVVVVVFSMRPPVEFIFNTSQKDVFPSFLPLNFSTWQHVPPLKYCTFSYWLEMVNLVSEISNWWVSYNALQESSPSSDWRSPNTQVFPLPSARQQSSRKQLAESASSGDMKTPEASTTLFADELSSSGSAPSISRLPEVGCLMPPLTPTILLMDIS